MYTRPKKRPPGLFLPDDVVFIFGSVLPGVQTGLVREVNAAEGMVSVVPRGHTEPVWFQAAQLKRIGGKGGKRMNGRPGRKPKAKAPTEGGAA